jgi:Spy/CpxP family protein refolding chaperone
MLKTLTAFILMSVSTALFAQASPAPDAGKKPRAERRFDCSKAKDPKACEQRVAKMKAARDKARQACQGKEGTEARDCMRREMCAQSADPAKCEARMKERAERRSRMREQHQKK